MQNVSVNYSLRTVWFCCVKWFCEQVCADSQDRSYGKTDDHLFRRMLFHIHTLPAHTYDQDPQCDNWQIPGLFIVMNDHARKKQSNQSHGLGMSRRHARRIGGIGSICPVGLHVFTHNMFQSKVYSDGASDSNCAYHYHTISADNPCDKKYNKNNVWCDF